MYTFSSVGFIINGAHLNKSNKYYNNLEFLLGSLNLSNKLRILWQDGAWTQHLLLQENHMMKTMHWEHPLKITTQITDYNHD